eukprot:6187284-Amphidinium_carterae.1
MLEKWYCEDQGFATEAIKVVEELGTEAAGGFSDRCLNEARRRMYEVLRVSPPDKALVSPGGFHINLLQA